VVTALFVSILPPIAFANGRIFRAASESLWVRKVDPPEIAVF
jgi:hypothetical protein